MDVTPRRAGGPRPAARLFVPLLTLAALVLTACGGGDGATATEADRTVVIEMFDNRFDPTAMDITYGETVRFVFRNKGKVDHDAFIGDEQAQIDHETEMGADEGEAMHHGGGDSDAITVEPGEQGELTHTFELAGTVLIGCHEPGHYAGGMKVTLNVA